MTARSFDEACKAFEKIQERKYEDKFWRPDDPRGTCGRYMPPLPFDEAEST